MKNHFLLSIILIFTSWTTTLGQWVDIRSQQATPARSELIKSNIETSIVQFSLDGFIKKPVTTPNGTEYIIEVLGGGLILETGAPELPMLAASVIIPDMSNMNINIVDSKYTEFHDIAVAPSKGNLTRDIDPSTVPFTYGAAYSKNEFFPNKIDQLREPYILRDVRGQTIVVNPFQYNPITKVLRVYYDIIVEVSTSAEMGTNTFKRNRASSSISSDFLPLYKNHFLNIETLTRYTPVDEEGDILIISYPDFMDAMAPYIDWKRKTGRNVEMISYATAGGTPAAMKTYISEYYHNEDKNLTYCLIVGDAQQVPPFFLSGSTGASDNRFSYIVGNDKYPEIFMGRFSAETVAHVETMVKRTIEYEQSPITEPDWYTKSISIASQEGGPSSHNGLIDYEHARMLQGHLNDFGYTYNYEFFEGSQGGNDASGNPTATMVGNALEEGASIINYTGHGTETSFHTSNFNINSINQLTNVNKLPFIWSVACVNGRFEGRTCFAEAWMRATDNEGNPTGAIATLMSSVNQSWTPPMAAQEEFNIIIAEKYPDNIKRTFGGIAAMGCMKMNDTYGNMGGNETDFWITFGDPSVMIRTKVPTELSVSHEPHIIIGSSTFSISANADCDGAVATISSESGEIYGKGTMKDGALEINFTNPVSTVEILKLTITHYNKIPVMTDVVVIAPSGPYVIVKNHTLSDSNNNNIIEFGETVKMSIDLNNVGVDAAANVKSKLSSTDEYITITTNEVTAGTINAGATTTLTDAFTFKVAGNVPDKHTAKFIITNTSDTSSWESKVNIILNAPSLEAEITSLVTANGAPVSVLNPGETYSATFKCTNNGVAASPIGNVTLSSSSQFVTFQNTTESLSAIPSNESQEVKFTFTCLPSMPLQYIVDFTLKVKYGEYETEQKFAYKCGLLIEDWENNNFDSFPWENGGNKPWTITEDEKHEGKYSAQSGKIGHNQRSILTLKHDCSLDVDSISFFYKTSSESFDKLIFYIDGNKQGEFGGNINWKKTSYPVTKGEHTFKWEYNKDNYGTNGKDCVWIDYILLPASLVKGISAGPDLFICDNEPATVMGQATLMDEITWTTSGDGSFDDIHAVIPTYTAGTQDIANKKVTLTITETVKEMTDSMTITYVNKPTVLAGDNDTTCEGVAYELKNASGADYKSIKWTTTGTGTFANDAELNTTYTPSAEDVTKENVTLKVTAEAIGQCDAAVASLELTVNAISESPAQPTGNVNVCSGSTEIYTVPSKNEVTVVWTIEPQNAGEITESENGVTITWERTFEGTAKLSAQLKNDCGISEAAELEINILKSPEGTISNEITEIDIFVNETTEFNIDPIQENLTYEWSVEPKEAATEIKNANSSSATFVWNNKFIEKEMTVICTVKDEHCAIELTHLISVKNTSGIEELGLQKTTLYPNPNNGSFNLNIKSNHSSNAINIRIINKLGETVYSENGIMIQNELTKAIDVNGNAPGMYYLIIMNSENGKTYTEKFIIK